MITLFRHAKSSPNVLTCLPSNWCIQRHIKLGPKLWTLMNNAQVVVSFFFEYIDIHCCFNMCWMIFFSFFSIRQQQWIESVVIYSFSSRILVWKDLINLFQRRWFSFFSPSKNSDFNIKFHAKKVTPNSKILSITFKKPSKNILRHFVHQLCAQIWTTQLDIVSDNYFYVGISLSLIPKIVFAILDHYRIIIKQV